MIKEETFLEIFTQMIEHEQVTFCNDPETGLKAIIAIHNTTLGPALGGCRMRLYHTVHDALKDALRLSKGMTYKCAAADVDFGGGKAVIIGDPNKDKSPELFRAFGQFVDSLNGRYYTGTDMGTKPEDFIHTAKETNFVVGLPEEYGGSGDSSIPTSLGVFYSIQATSKVLWGTESLADRTFAIQGLGKVGYKIAERLLEEGANLYITDIDEHTVKQFIKNHAEHYHSIKPVNSNEIYFVKADMFVPCAVGGVINDDTLEHFHFKAVVGSANNQLLEERHGEELQRRNILYAPDYIANAGGLIQVADELYGINKERVLQKTKTIYYTLLEIYKRSDEENISTAKAANLYCEQKIKQREKRNNFFAHQKRPKWQIQKI